MNEIEKAIAYYEEQFEIHGDDAFVQTSMRWEIVLQALREKQERENPQPLTLEELREMDGEPAWVKHLWPPEYGIKDKWYLVNSEDEELISATGNLTFGEACGICGLAYRYKPKEEQA